MNIKMRRFLEYLADYAEAQGNLDENFRQKIEEHPEMQEMHFVKCAQYLDFLNETKQDDSRGN